VLVIELESPCEQVTCTSERSYAQMKGSLYGLSVCTCMLVRLIEGVFLAAEAVYLLLLQNQCFPNTHCLKLVTEDVWVLYVGC